MTISKRTNPEIRLVKVDKEDCDECTAYIDCICAEVRDPGAAKKIKPLSSQIGPYLEGDYLVRRGDKFKSYYLVKKGVIRSEIVSYSGRNKVKWFYFPGDLIGMEAMSEGVWPADLVITKTTLLCELSAEDLEMAAQTFPEIQSRLFKRFGQRILNHEYALASDFSEASITRVVEYLLQLYDRLTDTEWVTGSRLQLPMTKTILASYLGMSAETFSRILAQLEKDGLIVNLPQAVELGDRARIEASMRSAQR